MLLIDIYLYIKRRADKRPVYLKNFVDQSHHHGTRTEDPSVSIIIPTRDKVELLRACVESVIEITIYKNYEIVVVDNQSVDPETLQYFDDLISRGVRILKYPQEFNYSAICNMAAANSTAKYLCFLNNDTEIIESDWLGNLVDHAEGQVGRPARGQHQLVVLGGVATEEHQLHRAQVAPVGLGEAHHLFVEAGHALQVPHVEAHVAERQGPGAFEQFAHVVS